MSAQDRTRSPWRAALINAAVVVLGGLLSLLLLWGTGVANLSFDLPALFASDKNVSDVVIIYIDEKSCRELNQSPKSWNRVLHAALVDHLTRDQAKLVAFDIWLADPGTSTANQELARAMKSNGKVVLAAWLDMEVRPGATSLTLLQPIPELLEAAAGWGIAALVEPKQSIIRRHYPNNDLGASLPWAAAKLLGAKATQAATGMEERWLNYYGPPGIFPSVSYSDVEQQPPGFFRDKVVFVGGRPKAQYLFEQTEEFLTPHSRWREGASPGVEIQATAFLNLWRGEWLCRLHPGLELASVLFAGLVLGAGLSRLPPLRSLGLGILVLLLLTGATLFLRSSVHLWFSWLTIGLVQIPLAMVGSAFLSLRTRLTAASAPQPVLPAPQPSAPALPAPAIHDGSTVLVSDTPAIPDHTLLRCVGKGAYGEVWLARNTVGLFHAVKIVHRRAFENDHPYEREFKGIQKFMPISRSHPGLVNLLHVGRNDAGGYFFYIMEVGDDVASGQEIDADRYVPRNLAGELRSRGRLPVAECVEMGLQLTSALGFLHARNLIHRDIKPSNIIYVRGAAKIADIGLVTEVGSRGRDVTYIGTEGYIAPEGPGTPAADLYSLGKVLYEISMGRDRHDFPDLPTSLVEKADNPGLMALNRIICRACEMKPDDRYRDADEMHRDLLALAPSP